MTETTTVDSPPRRRSRTWRVVRVLLLLVVVGPLVFAAVTARLFIWPPSSSPRHADAVVVLSGDHGERLPRALEYMQRTKATWLVQLGTPDSAANLELCAEPQQFKVLCLRPEPDSTRTEAQMLGRVAEQRGWRDVAVVTSSFHSTRAGILMRRCVEGQVRMIKAWPDFTPSIWARQIVHEWGGLLLATVRRPC